MKKILLLFTVCLLVGFNVYAVETEIKDHGTFTHTYDNGAPKTKGQYEDGIRVGKWEYWYPDGKRMLTEEYERGELQGRFTMWYTNGNKRVEGDFRHNKQINQWTYYKDDGSILKTVNYVNGKSVSQSNNKIINKKQSRNTDKLPNPNKDNAQLKAEGIPGNITKTPDTSDKDDAQLKAEGTPGLIE